MEDYYLRSKSIKYYYYNKVKELFPEKSKCQALKEIAKTIKPIIGLEIVKEELIFSGIINLMEEGNLMKRGNLETREELKNLKMIKEREEENDEEMAVIVRQYESDFVNEGLQRIRKQIIINLELEKEIREGR